LRQPQFQLPSVIPGGSLQGSQPWTPPIAPGPSWSFLPGNLPAALSTFSTGRLIEFHPTVLVSESWTDNFFQTPTDKQSDFRTVIGPGGVLMVNGATTKGTLQGNAGLTYDTTPSSGLNFNIFPTVTGTLTQTLGPRLTLNFSDTYVRNDNPSQADLFGLNRQRSTFGSNIFTATASYQLDQITTYVTYGNTLFLTGGTNGSNTVSNLFGGGFSTPIGATNSLQASYSYYWTDSSGTSAGENSGLTTGNIVTASLSHQLGLYSSVGLSGSFLTNASPESGNSYLWNASVFATYGLPPSLSVSGSLGYSQLISDEQATSGGISSNINLNYSFGQTTASIGVFSGYRPTGLTGQNFGIVQTVGVTGNLTQVFTPFISGSLNAYYSTNSFTGSGNNASAPNSGNLGASVSLYWQIRSWLSMNAGYYYTLRTGSNGSLFGPGNVSVNTVTLSLQAGY